MSVDPLPQALALVGDGGRLDLVDLASGRVVGHAPIRTSSTGTSSPRLSMRSDREGLVAGDFGPGAVFARVSEGGRRIEPGPALRAATVHTPTASVHHGRFAVMHDEGAVHVHGRAEGWESFPTPPDFDTRDVTVDREGVVFLAGGDRSAGRPVAAWRRLDRRPAGSSILPRLAWMAKLGMSLRGCTEGLDSIDVSGTPWVGSASSEWFLEEPSAYVVIRRPDDTWVARRGRGFRVVRVLRAHAGECVVVGSNGMLVRVRRDGAHSTSDAGRAIRQAVGRSLRAPTAGAALGEPVIVGADIHESHLLACVWFRAGEHVVSALVASPDTGDSWRTLDVEVAGARRIWDAGFAVPR